MKAKELAEKIGKKLNVNIEIDEDGNFNRDVGWIAALISEYTKAMQPKPIKDTTELANEITNIEKQYKKRMEDYYPVGFDARETLKLRMGECLHDVKVTLRNFYVNHFKTEIEAKDARVAELEKALDFYANPHNYNEESAPGNLVGGLDKDYWEDDNGEIARQALDARKEE